MHNPLRAHLTNRSALRTWVCFLAKIESKYYSNSVNILKEKRQQVRLVRERRAMIQNDIEAISYNAFKEKEIAESLFIFFVFLLQIVKN